jgi:ketosteroid isomerase-like protein
VIKDERVEEANVTEGCVAFYNADIVKLTRWLIPNQGVVVIAEDTDMVNRPEDIQDVSKATSDWTEAWAAREVDRYADHYADDFQFGSYDKLGYRSYKERVFNSYKVMKLTISNLRIISHPKYAVAIMDQDFFGDDRFSSIGRKILYWKKAADGKWKIMREIYENRRIEFVKFSSQDDKSGKQAAITGTEHGDVQSKL